MHTDKLRSFPCDVVPTCNDHKNAWQAQILDVIRYVLLLQHPSDLDEVTSGENANLSTIKTGSIVPHEISSLSLGCPGPRFGSDFGYE